MAQKLEKYELTDPKSGKVHTVMYGHHPSDDEIDQIFRLKEQEQQSLGQADKASKVLNPPGIDLEDVKRVEQLGPAAIIPYVMKSPAYKQALGAIKDQTLTPENAAAAIITALAPEFGLPMLATMTGAEAVPQAYQTYKNPTVENISKSVGQALSLGLLGLGIKGNPGMRTYRSAGELPEAGPIITPPPKVTPPPTLALPEGVTPRLTSGEGPLITPPPTGMPRVQLQLPRPGETYTPNIPTVKAPIITPPPEGSILQSGVTILQPKGAVTPSGNLAPGVRGRFVSPTKATGVKSFYTGEGTPIVKPPSQTPTTMRPQVPLETPTPTTTPPAPVETVKPQAQTPTPPKIGELENKWLTQTDTPLLQTMRDGAPDKLKTEIDSVLNSRGVQQQVAKEALPKGQTPDPNDEIFGQYKSLLEDSINHGKEIGSVALRDIAKRGKDAGLDNETIASDLLDSIHPEVTNPNGKVWNAINKVFSPEKEE